MLNPPLVAYLDTGTGKHHKIVNISEIAAEMKRADYCTTILGLYVFTDEDLTSAFNGKGKVRPLKKLQSHPKYHAAFRWEFFSLCDKCKSVTWKSCNSLLKILLHDLTMYQCFLFQTTRWWLVHKAKNDGWHWELHMSNVCSSPGEIGECCTAASCWSRWSGKMRNWRPNQEWISDSSHLAETALFHTFTLWTIALPTQKEPTRQSYASPGPTLLNETGRRRTRAS